MAGSKTIERSGFRERTQRACMRASRPHSQGLTNLGQQKPLSAYSAVFMCHHFVQLWIGFDPAFVDKSAGTGGRLGILSPSTLRPLWLSRLLKFILGRQLPTGFKLH
jgi:hypothetical protein